MTKSEILAASSAPKAVSPTHGDNGANAGTPFVIDGDFYRWSPVASGIQIELHVETVRRISHDLISVAARETGDDIGGLLVGQTSKVAPRTFRVIAVESCRSIQLHSVLTIVTNRMAPYNRGGSVLGFYRIVDRDKLVLSDLDMYLALSRFEKQDKAFLLVETAASGRTRARFFFWNGAERRPASELLEFPVVECEPGEPPSGWSQEAHEAFPAAMAAEQEEPRDSSRVAIWIQQRKPLLLGLAMAIVAVAVVAYLVSVRLTPIRPVTTPIAETGSPLELKVTPEEDGGMWLSWSTSAPVMATAQTGLVTIRDGERKSQRILDREQLLNGKLFYISRSESVEFSAQFFGADSMQTDSVTAFLMKPKTSEEIASADAGSVASPGAPRQGRTTPTPLAANPANFRPGEPSISTASPALPGRASIPAPAANTSAPPPVTLSQPEPRRASTTPAKEQQTNPVRSESVPPIATQPAAGTAPPQKEPDPPKPIQTAPATAPPVTDRRQDADPPPPPAGQAPRTVPAIGPPQLPSASVIYPSVVRTVPATSPGSPIEKAEQYIGPKVVAQVKPSIPQGLNGLIRKDVVVEVHLSIDSTGKVTDADAPPGPDALYASLAKASVDTARRWKFEPARRGNRPVASDLTLTFKFTPAR